MVRFTGMSRNSRWSAWAIVGLYMTQVLAGVLLGNYLLSLPLSWWTIAGTFLAAVFIGTRFRGLNNIVHECSHSTFSSNREDNVRIGKLCSAMRAGCFKTYKKDHLSHHAHLGDYELDNEFRPIENLRLHDPLSVSTILRHAATPLLGTHLKAYSGIDLSRDDGGFFFGLKVLVLVAISVLIVMQPVTTLLFVVIPLFFIFPTLNYWTDCLDHAGLVGSKDELEASRNVLATSPVRLVFFPRNDCYHLVHHLFPHVPARHLHEAHNELCTDPEYLSQPTATRPTRLEIADIVSNALSPKKGAPVESQQG